jgi:hypothetical protein
MLVCLGREYSLILVCLGREYSLILLCLGRENSLILVCLGKLWEIGEGMKSGTLLKVRGTPRVGGNFSDTAV